MDEAGVPALLETEFGKGVLAAIKRAYRIRADGHRSGDGDNAMTFGMNVRFSIEKFVDDAFARDSQVVIARPAGSFQAAFAGHLYHFYKFGSDASDSVDALDFDDSETKMNIVAYNQMSLPGIPDMRHLIVAHSGNPEDGLLEIYVGAPDALGHDGSPWAWRYCIHSDERVAQRAKQNDAVSDSRPSFLDQPEPPVNVVPKRSPRIGEMIGENSLGKERE
jgi:hypothetical protein